MFSKIQSNNYISGYSRPLQTKSPSQIAFKGISGTKIEKSAADLAQELIKVNAELARTKAELIAEQTAHAATRFELRSAKDKLSIIETQVAELLQSVGKKVPKSIIDGVNELGKLARLDGMTALFNKLSLMANVTHLYRDASKTGKNLCVGMFDMDFFKGVNEVFDHKTGDEFLVRIATNIHNVAKSHGAKGYRYGGEEFTILMPGKNADEAKGIMEEIADAIRTDPEIQKHLPEFIDKATKALNTLDAVSRRLNKEIFPKLRKEEDEIDYRKLAYNIITFIDDHIATYQPSDTEVLESIVTKIRTTKPEKLPEVLTVDLQFGDTTLGVELNKIDMPYKTLLNDLQKWVTHLRNHKAFTISGGVVDSKGLNLPDNGQSLIEIADKALKAAKNDGKNTVKVANSEIIDSVIAQ